MKRSTQGEGHERRFFYGSVWAVCIAQPVLWLLWKVLPQTRIGDAVKLAIFLGILAFVGQPRPARPAPPDPSDPAGRSGGLRLNSHTPKEWGIGNGGMGTADWGLRIADGMRIAGIADCELEIGRLEIGS